MCNNFSDNRRTARTKVFSFKHSIRKDIFGDTGCKPTLPIQKKQYRMQQFDLGEKDERRVFFESRTQQSRQREGKMGHAQRLWITAAH